MLLGGASTAKYQRGVSSTHYSCNRMLRPQRTYHVSRRGKWSKVQSGMGFDPCLTLTVRVSGGSVN